MLICKNLSVKSPGKHTIKAFLQNPSNGPVVV